jgi:hypothetical protein
MKIRRLTKGIFILVLLLMSLSLTKCEKTACDSSSPNRTGAVCNDGTTSSSVGSGTCSSHGGVKYWLCN